MDDKSKILKNLIKQEIKQEPGRLSSLNVARDLNLGGTKSRKLYVPNLNAIRNKNKSLPSTSKGPKQRETRKNANRTPKNHGNEGRYVQSTGVFSEGASEVKRPTIHSDKHSSSREAETNSGMIKPKLGNSWNVDIKEEAMVVDDLLTCDDSGSDEEGEYEPIILPLSANGDGFMNTFKVPDIKQEIIKNETKGNIRNNAKVLQNCSFTSNKCFDDDDFLVSLVKMPDSLPGKGFDEQNNAIDYTLDQMMEGKIGKILVRESGKIELVIGNTRYTLDAIEAAPFREELMCMPPTEELKTEPVMTCLGTLDEKFVISPIWSTLLTNKRKKTI